MLAVAALGVVVNGAALLILHGGDRRNLNLRGATAHVLGDLLGSAAAVVGAVIILRSGWTPIDPILSILVGLLVLRSAWRILRDAGHILLEGTPAQIDPQGLRTALMEDIPALTDVHHIHARSLTTERPLITLHAPARDTADPQAVPEPTNPVLPSH